VQANVLNHLPTRIRVPLVAEKFLKPESRLNPQIEIDGQKYYIHALEIATFRGNCYDGALPISKVIATRSLLPSTLSFLGSE
jgi:hypothetical protein